jgi:hypothetical protein
MISPLSSTEPACENCGSQLDQRLLASLRAPHAFTLATMSQQARIQMAIVARGTVREQEIELPRLT